MDALDLADKDGNGVTLGKLFKDNEVNHNDELFLRPACPSNEALLKCPTYVKTKMHWCHRQDLVLLRVRRKGSAMQERTRTSLPWAMLPFRIARSRMLRLFPATTAPLVRCTQGVLGLVTTRRLQKLVTVLVRGQRRIDAAVSTVERKKLQEQKGRIYLRGNRRRSTWVQVWRRLL